MSTSIQFATADVFTGQYKSKADFIDGILSRLKIAARQDGWTGTALHSASWITRRGEPDMAVIALQPGAGDVSVADVRIYLIEKRQQERKAAA